MLRNEFEDILILDSPYYKNLTKTYRDTVNFNRYISILKQIVKVEGFLETFENKGGRELVYLGRKIFSLQEEFVTNYLNFLSDQSMINKWEEFFERYSKNIFEIYQRFVAKDSNKILIFEIVNRKLLRDLLTKHTYDTRIENRAVIAERFGVVVNQLFNYIRNSLNEDITVNDELIIYTYEKIPLLPRCDRSETMKLLAKNFLQQGLPENLYTAISKSIMTTYYVETKTKVIDALDKLIILTKDNIREIFKTHFFFPDEDSLTEIIGLLSKKANEKMKIVKNKKEEIDKKVAVTRRKIKETMNTIKGELIGLAENFSTEESIDKMIKRLRRNLISSAYDLRIFTNQYQEYVKKESELDSIVNLKPGDLQKFIQKNEWDPYIILTFSGGKKVGDEQLQTMVKEALGEIKGDKEAMEVMNRYRVTGFLKEKYDTTKIMERVQTINREIILPLVKSFLLEELVDYYPKLSGVVSAESIRFLAEEALAGKVSVIEKDIKVSPVQKSEHPLLNILRYKELVSIFVYDIRGSTFMGTKLMDAKRESEIRNFFQESMLSVVEKYGGVPIKDTGDGGIVIFSANHQAVKNHETLELKGGSVLSAVRSGLEMTQVAESFMQENINKYQDWFREAEKRKINFEGATYATLPPSYQAIFQIGVGIASGVYPKEIFLDKNAFGELDVTGMLIREANFYSKVKAKAKSTVIVDDASVYNLLLNVNKFSFLSEAGLRIDPLLLNIEQGLEYWINQKFTRRGFILDLYKIFVTQLGQEISHPGSLKIIVGDFDIEIDETGEIKDDKGGRGKFLFEVFSEATK
ncbi:MAG: hypothetical protein WBB67_14960 [bacterium]